MTAPAILREMLRPLGQRRVRLAAAVAVAAVIGAAGGTAFAVFTGTGSGSGTATVGQAASVTVAAASATADLLPGGTGAATFTLHNTNPYGVSFASVTAASVASNDTTACPSSNVSVAPTIPYVLSPALTVAANSTSGALSIPNLVQLSASAPSSCQGVSFTVTLTLSGTQS